MKSHNGEASAESRELYARYMRWVGDPANGASVDLGSGHANFAAMIGANLRFATLIGAERASQGSGDQAVRS